MIPESRNPVFGREAELREIEAFLDAAQGDTTALRIEGEAGVGKTTLWAEAVRLGRDNGLRVLSASASEQETKLAFATLSDLLGDVLDEVADDLHPPQRKAIDVALLRAESEGVRPDRRAVGLAVVDTMRHLAESTRVLVSIDDVQWVDASSAPALAFAVRRLSGVPVRVIATLRVGPGLAHGLFSVGCCWALMLVGFAAGVANLWWMAALTAVMVFEKTGRGGERGVVPIGAGLITLGVLTLIAPSWALVGSS